MKWKPLHIRESSTFQRDRRQSKELAHEEDDGSIRHTEVIRLSALQGKWGEEVLSLLLPTVAVNLDLKCPLEALFPTRPVQRCSRLERLDRPQGPGLINRLLFTELLWLSMETFKGVVYMREVNYWSAPMNQ